MSDPDASAAPAAGWSGRILTDLDLSFDLRPAWRRDDAALAAAATGFWARLGVLPAGVGAEERARELAAVAYHNGEVGAVSTAVIAPYEPLRGRFAFYRCAVDPAHRRNLLAAAITNYTRDLISDWSAAHPEEKVLGLAAVIESPDLKGRQRMPVWANSQLNLVGFLPDGRQVRVSWFDHARID